MRRLYYILTRTAVISPPKGYNVIFPSFTISEGTWLTLVSVKHKNTGHWDNDNVFIDFAHEGIFALQFMTFSEV